MSNISQNQSTSLFMDEFVQDFEISLSGLMCSTCEPSLPTIGDLNRVISTLGDTAVKVEEIVSEDNARDSLDIVNHCENPVLSPESPQSNDSCCSTSTDSDNKKLVVNYKDRTNSISRQDKQTIKRLCFKGFNAEELSPISSVDSQRSERTENFDFRESSDSQSSQTNKKNTVNSYDYSWRRYSKTDAPSVANKVSSVQIGQSVKSEPNNRSFQYILGAATASGIKLGSMTMTYLNQGQSYELRLKKVSDIPDYDGKNLRSSVRLGFVEKRLQYRETEEMTNWCRMHSKDRIIDVDFALSYGIFDVSLDSTNINCVHFQWNPNREASIFIKLNCISTEFTSKRHGGERGAPLRLLVSTFNYTQSHRFDSAACLVKVFKSKGADRKHKTDRDRIAKQPDSSLYFQPSYDCTLFTAFNDEELPLRTISSNIIQDNRSVSTPSPSQSPIDSPLSSVQLNVATSSTNYLYSPQPSSIQSDDSYSTPTQTSKVLPLDSTASETHDWLMKNRFNKLIDILTDFTASDLRRLSREDLIQICGITDGIRLYNTIHSIDGTTRLTIFVTTDGNVHQAIYLKLLTVDEMREKLLDELNLSGLTIRNIYMIGPNNIKIKLTNSVIQNIKNETIYNCSIDTVNDEYDIVLHLAF